MFTMIVSVESSSSQGTVKYYVYTESFSFCALTKNGDICRDAHGITRDFIGSYTGIVPSQGPGDIDNSELCNVVTDTLSIRREPPDRR